MDEEENEAEEDLSAFTPYEARRDTFGLRNIPGAAFKSHLDTTHPIAFGMKEQLYSLTYSKDQFVPSSSYRVVGHYEKEASDLLASGYASQ